MFDLKFQGQSSRSQHWYVFFLLSDLDWVLIDTKHEFLRYILPEISHWMRYVMFDLEFQGLKGQGHNIDKFLFEFPDITLVGIDTKLRFYRIAIKRYWIMSRGQKWPLPVLIGPEIWSYATGRKPKFQKLLMTHIFQLNKLTSETDACP